jgi:hypothetical protein
MSWRTAIACASAALAASKRDAHQKAESPFGTAELREAPNADGRVGKAVTTGALGKKGRLLQVGDCGIGLVAPGDHKPTQCRESFGRQGRYRCGGRRFGQRKLRELRGEAGPCGGLAPCCAARCRLCQCQGRLRLFHLHRRCFPQGCATSDSPCRGGQGFDRAVEHRPLAGSADPVPPEIVQQDRCLMAGILGHALGEPGSGLARLPVQPGLPRKPDGACEPCVVFGEIATAFDAPLLDGGARHELVRTRGQCAGVGTGRRAAGHGGDNGGMIVQRGLDGCRIGKRGLGLGRHGQQQGGDKQSHAPASSASSRSARPSP